MGTAVLSAQHIISILIQKWEECSLPLHVEGSRKETDSLSESKLIATLCTDHSTALAQHMKNEV